LVNVRIGLCLNGVLFTRFSRRMIVYLIAPLGHINYFYTSKLNQEIGVNSLLINIGGDVYQSETLIQCIFNFACTTSVSRCNQRFFN